MSIPKELGLPSKLVAKQIRCVYGTRDAGKIWESCYTEALVDMGFVQGSGSPCCFHHPARGLHCVVHGDDFTCMGLGADLDFYESELSKRFDIKVRGRLGEGCPMQEIQILSWILRVTKDGVEYEADPRRVELLTSSMNPTSANSAKTPGVKDPDPNFVDDKGPEIDNEPMHCDLGDSDEPQIHHLATKVERRRLFDGSPRYQIQFRRRCH